MSIKRTDQAHAKMNYIFCDKKCTCTSLCVSVCVFVRVEGRISPGYEIFRTGGDRGRELQVNITDSPVSGSVSTISTAV